MKGLIPYITVASSSATAIRKATADYYCDGVHDQVEINLALADADAAGGGHVYCSHGTYTISDTILVHSNTTLEFSAGSEIVVPTIGMALDITQLKNTDKVVLAIRNADRVAGNTRIRIVGVNLDFQGTGKELVAGYTDANWAGIWLDNCTFSSIEKCKAIDIVQDMSHTYRACGLLLSDSEYCFIRDSIANESGYEGAGIRGDCRRCFIENLHAQSNYAHMAQIAPWTPTITGDPRYCKIINSKCTDPATDTTDFILHSYVRQENNAIIGCYASSINVRGQHSGALIANNNVINTIRISDDNLGKICQGVIVSRNILRAGYSQADTDRIKVDAANCSSAGSIKDIIISENKVYGGYIRINSAAGIPTTIDNVRIQNNIVEYSGATQPNSAIRITHGGTGLINNISISNNIIRPALNENAIIIAGTSSGDIENVRIHHNNIPTGYRGIKITNLAGQTGTINNIRVENNTVHLLSSFVAAEARTSNIHILSNHIITCGYLFSGPGDFWFINGNTIDAIVTALSTGAPTNIQYGFNFGQITGLWRFIANPADLDQMLLQQYSGAAFNTLETWDLSP